MAGSNVQSTPIELFKIYEHEYDLYLDVCAIPENAKCLMFFSPKIDGLTQNWAPHRCWMNPPYSTDDGKPWAYEWLKKAVDEAKMGATVVALLRADFSTAWWRDHVMKAHRIELFLGSRVKYNDKPAPPFCTCAAIFLPERRLTPEPITVFRDWRADYQWYVNHGRIAA